MQTRKTCKDDCKLLLANHSSRLLLQILSVLPQNKGTNIRMLMLTVLKAVIVKSMIFWVLRIVFLLRCHRVRN
jgi:hypothetical protein